MDNQTGAIDEIIAARKEGDNDTAVRAAHTLKGVGGSIGAGELQRLGAELEQGLKESPEGDFDALLATTREELQRIIDAIATALGTGETSMPAPAEPLPADYPQRLQALAAQLAEYDGEASDTLGQLIDEVSDPQVRAQLEKLAKQVDQYDYDSAQALVDEMMA